MNSGSSPGYDRYDSADREWWVQGWLDLLNSYRFKKRLERARDYARQGNVLSIEFRGAKVLARVQGTEPEPYRVSLSLDPFADDAWEGVVESLSQRAIYAAQLLAGEMPQDIETVFTANGLSLFPFSLSEIHSKCSCPDKANPCKHIGAVYYLLGDRFSDDPFVLFRLRGRTQEQIIAALREVRSQHIDLDAAAQAAAQARGIAAVDGAEVPTETGQPAVNLSRFWRYDQPLEPALVVIAPPPDSSTPLSVLGPVPMPADGTGAPGDRRTVTKAVNQYFQEVYQTASQQAIIAGLGQ